MLVRFYILVALLVFPSLAMGQEICGMASADEARAEVKQISIRLKIANFRADVGYMTAMKDELKALLNRCQAPADATNAAGSPLSATERKTERLRQIGLVCDWSCFANLGTYYLFMASDYKFLSMAGEATAAGDTQHAEKAAAFADEGRGFMDLGVQVISRQQGPDSSIRDYLTQNAVLNNLRIQMQMAKGDVWYQSMSNLAITRVAQGAAEAINPATPSLGEACSPTNKQACALGYAMAYYEDALWTAIEAQTDIPAGSEYDSLRITLQEIIINLNRRRDSIRAGHLFLNIDPEAYTYITFDELSNLLRPTIARLNELDAKIQNHIQVWQAEVQNNTYRDIDEANIKKQEGIALSGHKIGLIEAEAASAVAKLNQQKAELDGSNALMDRQKALKMMQFELQRVQRDIAWQHDQLTVRTERELLAISKATTLEKQGRLRWLINMSITNMNLDMQELALEAQSLEYSRQIENNDLQKALVNSNIDQMETQKKSENLNIDIANDQIVSLNISKVEAFEAARLGLRNDICRIEMEYDFLGVDASVANEDKFTRYPPVGVDDPLGACSRVTTTETRESLMAEVCDETTGVYALLNENRMNGLAAFYACGEESGLLVADAPEGSSLLTTADRDAFVTRMTEEMKAASGDPTAEYILPDCSEIGLASEHFAQMRTVLDQEVNIAELEWDNLKNYKARLVGQITFLVGAGITIAALEAAEDTAKALEVTIGSLPVIGSGLLSGTLVYPAVTARAVSETASAALRSARAGVSFTTQVMEYNSKLAQIKDSIEVAFTRINLAKYRKEQALLQLGYQSEQDTINQIYQHRLSMNGCKKEQEALINDAVRLSYQHKQLTSQLQGLLIKNDQIDLEIGIQEKRIDQYKGNIAVLDARIIDEEKKLANLDKDRTTLEELKANVSQRIGMVIDTRVQVNALVKEEGSISDRIAEIYKSEANAIFALDAAERVHLDAVLSGETSKSAQLQNLEQEIIGNLSQSNALGQNIAATMVAAKDLVVGEQEKIVSASIDIAASDRGEEKDKAFLASQEQLSDLLPGVPDLIKAKKALMPTVNYVLNLIRARYRSISGLGNEGFNKAVIQGEIGSGAYVTKVDQIQSIYQNWAEKNILDESPINIEKPVIRVPQDSTFAQQLVKNGRINFAVNPRVSGDSSEATKANMASAGYLTLWDVAMDNGNPRLIDVMIGFETADTQCAGESPNFSLTHKGFGFIYPTSTGDTLELPAIAVGPDVHASQAFLSKPSDPDGSGMSRYRAKKAVWDASPRVNTFDRENQGADAARYLGLPVAANYELILHKSDCLYDGSGDIYLFFAVATDTPQ